MGAVGEAAPAERGDAIGGRLLVAEHGQLGRAAASGQGLGALAANLTKTSIVWPPSYKIEEISCSPRTGSERGWERTSRWCRGPRGAGEGDALKIYRGTVSSLRSYHHAKVGGSSQRRRRTKFPRRWELGDRGG
jgi:hypothetical protein